MSQLPALLRVFSYMSLISIGGGMAAFPDMKMQVVEVHHWLSFTQLIHLYSIGQMMPGPNMMMIVPIGDWAAGPLGALTAGAAFFGPTALLTFAAGRLWKRLETWPWRNAIQQGLAPVSVGLLLAGAFSIAKGTITGVETASITVGVLLILLQFRINPALLVVGGGIIGLLTYTNI